MRSKVYVLSILGGELSGATLTKVQKHHMSWFKVFEEYVSSSCVFFNKLCFQVHSRGKALAKDVDFEKIARRTPGFTGADLQNLMNEAAILAARRDLKEISKDEISDALERIIAGPEKKNAVVSDEKKKLVAYHGIIKIFPVIFFSSFVPVHQFYLGAYYRISVLICRGGSCFSWCLDAGI